MSDLSRIMDGHKIVLISGAPDYYAIRQIEKEIYEAPITEYPGEWDDLTIEDHYTAEHYRYGLTGHGRCMWCEDMRHKSKIIQAEVRADMDAAVRRTREADRPSLWSRVPWPVRTAIYLAAIWAVTIACTVVWG